MSEPPKGAEGDRGRTPGRPGGGPSPQGPRHSGPGPKGPGRPQRSGGPQARRSGQKPGSIGLKRVGGNDFELVHPRGVEDVELDYEEGLEIWKAGDPEGARDALRYALAACRDNLWIHVGLGRIALEEFRDPDAGPGPFRLRGRAGPPGVAPAVRRPAARRPAGQSALLRRPRGADPLPRGPGPRGDSGDLRDLRDRLSAGGPIGHGAASGTSPIQGVKKARRARAAFSTLGIFRTCRDPPIGIERPQTETHKQKEWPGTHVRYARADGKESERR